MALVSVNLIDTFDEWRIKTNSISSGGGDLVALTTTDKTNLVNAINEVKVVGQGKLENVVEDTTPELGGDLSLNNYNITGTGNISITGSYTGTLDTSVTGVTQANGDNSTKIATTEYVQNTFGTVAVGGDISGTVGNAQIASNVVGITELDVSDGTNGQALCTNGAGVLSFATLDLTVGGDISGTLSNAQIVSNTIGTNELNLSEGTAGQVITTDGAGTISYQSLFAETTISPTAGQTVFNITYTVGRIVMFLNGVKLVDGVDFTATNGTDVTLTTGVLNVTDVVEFHTFV